MRAKLATVLGAALVASVAQAVTFTMGSAGSMPTFTTATGSTSLTATPSGNTYVVNGLPFTLTTPASNFGWDFYATADPGKYITGASFTFTFSGNLTNTFAQTVTNANRVSGNAEFAVPGNAQNFGPIPPTLTQSISVGGQFTQYHFFVSDTFYVPAGVSVTGITGTVGEVDQPVPEPASVVALGLGALSLLRCRRKA